MAYSSTNVLVGTPAGVIGMTWMYASSHLSSEIADVPGFFTGTGAGGRSNSCLGIRIGDPILIIGNSNSPTPGESVWLNAIRSTANQTSTSSSTGWNAGYDVTAGGSITSTAGQST